MPKYIIERSVPGIGKYTDAQIKEIISKIKAGLQSMGGRVHWLESFVSDDKIFSIYTAPDLPTLREFGKLSRLATDGSHPLRSRTPAARHQHPERRSHRQRL